ncbi:MAG TPA: GGDEF domain-containing protein, partial [Deinococcales bacterium]|nr:GGDEF domain-containing protein [Deinococcales bacterium]
HHDARKRGREIALAWEEATTARDHAETLAVQMRHAALHDALTGLRNRRAFDHDLASELTRAARHAHPVTVAVIDLDGLKRVNDGRGHARGDELLCALTREMQQRLRGEDHLYRTGGDEFAAILPHAATSAAHELLARLRAATDAVREAGFPEAGASIGLATFPDEARDSFALLKLADDRMYRDKAAHYAAQG